MTLYEIFMITISLVNTSMLVWMTFNRDDEKVVIETHNSIEDFEIVTELKRKPHMSKSIHPDQKN